MTADSPCLFSSTGGTNKGSATRRFIRDSKILTSPALTVYKLPQVGFWIFTNPKVVVLILCICPHTRLRTLSSDSWMIIHTKPLITDKDGTVNHHIQCMDEITNAILPFCYRSHIFPVGKSHPGYEDDPNWRYIENNCPAPLHYHRGRFTIIFITLRVNFRSLCEPAILPLTTDHLPSGAKLISDFTEKQYDLVLLGTTDNGEYL